MTRELAIKISDADEYHSAAAEISEAIMKLSERYPTAINHLIDAYAQNVMDAEIAWREIESMAEYQERYTSRDEAAADFLKSS